MNPLFLFALLSTQAFAAKPAIPDFPPDAPSTMLRAALGPRLLLSEADGLDAIVADGERNLAWLNHINSLRPANDKLSLTSKETQRGIPIDKPSEYNPTLIQQKLDELKPKIPGPMRDVLFSAVTFPDGPNVPLADYLSAARELDRVYQSALRWRMMGPYLEYLADRRHQDVRGWYFLSRLEGRADKLHDFAQQPAPLQGQLREWLVGLCYNSDDGDSVQGCQTAVDAKISGGQDLEAYYQLLAPASEQIYQSYFQIPDGVGRREISEIGGASPLLRVPFTDPGTDEVRHFLQDNIQDEWRFGNWHLELPLATTAGLAHVEFLPGVTPHVNQIGGDTIVMNATQPLTEYDANWTIRHEFGHVLGFLDCYVEFYVREKNVIVNYQFDIDNLMCSRKGHIQQRHVEELTRVYTR